MMRAYASAGGSGIEPYERCGVTPSASSPGSRALRSAIDVLGPILDRRAIGHRDATGPYVRGMTSSLDSNTLAVGERRFGRLVGDVARVGGGDVVLERTIDGIVLEVPWSSPDDGPVPRWFRAEVDVLDLVEESNRGTPKTFDGVPRLLQFSDRRGFVTLIGCRKAGYSTRSGGPGSGRIRVQRAVFGGREVRLHRRSRAPNDRVSSP